MIPTEPSRVLALGENTRTRAIAQRLVFLGYQVDWALTAAEAEALVKRYSYRAVVGSLRDWPDGVFHLALSEGAEGQAAFRVAAEDYAPPALIWLEHHEGIRASAGSQSQEHHEGIRASVGSQSQEHHEGIRASAGSQSQEHHEGIRASAGSHSQSVEA